MDLTSIAVFSLFALIYVTLLPARWRGWVLMIASILTVYWLQPTLNIRWLDFSLATAIILITLLSWWIVGRVHNTTENRFTREDVIALALSIVLIVLISLTRFLVPELRLTSRPPDIISVIVGVVLFLGLGGMVVRFGGQQRWFLSASILVIVILFVFTKSEVLAEWLSGVLRIQTGQDATLANALDIEWLGFSYVAFRLIHTIRDRQTGQLPDVSLREYMTYVVFFPSITAGPIDRLERFSKDFQALPAMVGLDAERITEGARRISIGLFKKFVIADSLALIALNDTNALQTESGLSLWVLLYAYAFRLYLDFSGYTDIAIGIGIWFGITLPENFDRPYLKNNITTFWQSWHMTLSNWVRFYIFSPLSRWLLTRSWKPPSRAIILISHLTTMIVIGLWHGITWGFFVWGVWHGLGLFVHKLWSDRTRKWYRGLKDQPRQKLAWTVVGVVITFHFVVISWVFFALSDINLSLSVLSRLFGGGV